MRWYPRAVIAALGVGLVAGVLLGSGDSTVSRPGGDYPAFYGAGRIAVDNDWEHLYTPNRQAEAMGLVEPSREYLHFVYPPFVAAAYAPLALLPYRVSYLIHTLLMVAAVAASIWMAGAKFPFLRQHRPLALLLALLFWPMTFAVMSGQNSALLLFLMVAVWRLATDRHDFYAGLILSLLLFKPQYAVPMILLYLIAGRWRVVVGSLSGAGLLYAAGALVMGVGWLNAWWVPLREFAELDAIANGKYSISFIGFATNLLDSTWLVVLLGVVPAITVAVVLAIIWLRERPGALAEKTALAATGLILISPHTMFYDGALILITFVVLEARSSPSPKRIALVWLAASSQVLVDVLGWSPLFFVVLGVAVWAGRSLGQALLDAPSHQPSTTEH